MVLGLWDPSLFLGNFPDGESSLGSCNMLTCHTSDMNDRNVMIGDYDFDDSGGQHAHDQVPSLKVGDLGIIRSFRSRTLPNRAGVDVEMAGKAEARITGNYWTYTPEQFTRTFSNVASSL